jgi:hypothetical protein
MTRQLFLPDHRETPFLLPRHPGVFTTARSPDEIYVSGAPYFAIRPATQSCPSTTRGMKAQARGSPSNTVQHRILILPNSSPENIKFPGPEFVRRSINLHDWSMFLNHLFPRYCFDRNGSSYSVFSCLFSPFKPPAHLAPSPIPIFRQRPYPERQKVPRRQKRSRTLPKAASSIEWHSRSISPSYSLLRPLKMEQAFLYAPRHPHHRRHQTRTVFSSHHYQSYRH